MFTTSTTSTRNFPKYGFVGLALCLAAWACSWLRVEPLYRYSFFPLWFGYIIFMDALVVLRRGESLLTRMRWRYILLFGMSSVFWWVFEFLNTPAQNWHYRMDQPYTPLAYLLIASLDFSTVLPAVLETAEFLSSFELWRPRLPANEAGPRLPLWMTITLVALGIACLILPWLFPQYCFVLIWLSVVLILDPLNNAFGRKSAFAHIAAGDWHFFVLPLAGLCCGFLWEMWNYYALPKWYYTISYVGFFKVFEMPILGYTGYLPFALELFAMYQFILLVTGQKKDYLAI